MTAWAWLACQYVWCARVCVCVCVCVWASVWQWQEGKAYAFSRGYKTKNDRLWMCVCECLSKQAESECMCTKEMVFVNALSCCSKHKLALHLTSWPRERERCRMKQGSLILNSPEMDRNLLSLWLECDSLWSSSVLLQPTHNLSTHTTCFSLASVSLSLCLSRWVNTFYSRSFMRKLIRNDFHPQ